MKKVLSLLAIMAIASGMVFAAADGFVAGRAVSELSGGATLDVTLNVTSEMQNYFEIGFTNSQVSDFAADVTPMTDLEIATERGNGEIGNTGSDAYVYWKAKGDDINVSLAKSENMTGNAASETLDWIVTAGGTSVETSGTVIGATDGAESAGKAGSAVLDIVTDGFTPASGAMWTSSAFTGTLTVTVAAK